MNVFMVDSCPVKAAQALCDKHVVKMVLESAQVASTVLRERGDTSPLLYRPTHKNHPCTRAVAENKDYANWFMAHALSLACEYTHRFGKVHKSQRILEHSMPRLCTPLGKLLPSDVPQAMPEWCQVEGDPVLAYQQWIVYKYLKRWNYGDARWTNRTPPDWYVNAAATSFVGKTTDEKQALAKRSARREFDKKYLKQLRDVGIETINITLEDENFRLSVTDLLLEVMEEEVVYLEDELTDVYERMEYYP